MSLHARASLPYLYVYCTITQHLPSDAFTSSRCIGTQAWLNPPTHLPSHRLDNLPILPRPRSILILLQASQRLGSVHQCSPIYHQHYHTVRTHVHHRKLWLHHRNHPRATHSRHNSTASTIKPSVFGSSTLSHQNYRRHIQTILHFSQHTSPVPWSA